MEILNAIRKLLDESQVPFKEIHHQPTYTSEESAKARGESVEIGGKAILLKSEDEFRLFVLKASMRLDSKSIRHQFGLRRIRFATSEELMEQTGLVPGSVPPFGHPILPFEVFVDSKILDNKKIAFNAGSLEDSIVMRVEDYLRIARPKILQFSRR